MRAVAAEAVETRSPSACRSRQDPVDPRSRLATVASPAVQRPVTPRGPSPPALLTRCNLRRSGCRLLQMWRLALTRALAAWTEASRFLRAASLLSWALGAACLALGWRLDASGGWQNFPFLTNMFSALCGALFGIPVALLLLQQLSRYEIDRAERRAAIRLAQRVTQDLIGRLEQIAPVDLWERLAAIVPRLRDGVGATETLLGGQSHQWNVSDLSRSLATVTAAWEEACELWQRQGRSVQSLQQELVILRTRWDLVLSAIGPQMLAWDLPFPSAQRANSIERSLEGLLADFRHWVLESDFEQALARLRRDVAWLHEHGVDEDDELELMSIPGDIRLAVRLLDSLLGRDGFEGLYDKLDGLRINLHELRQEALSLHSLEA